MKVIDFCENYFKGFQEISDYKNNNIVTNFLATLKIISYFTVVIPLGFITVYGASSLYGRFTKKENFSTQDATVISQAKMHIFPKIPSTEEMNNSKLATEIIKKRNDLHVIALCKSPGFLMNPTYHLISEMIERGTGMARTDDDARAFVITQIPGFIENLSSPDYLSSFAEFYFTSNPQKEIIIKIFEKSVLTEEFQNDLKLAVEKFKGAKKEDELYLGEQALRVPLTIYVQSATQAEPYQSPRKMGIPESSIYRKF
jgi:hypothetical protein